MAGPYPLPVHSHGKSRVRVSRVWREGDVHHFCEWSVNTMLESPMEHSFINGENTGMTATDTQKNTVYIVAKRMSQRCSVDEYAIALAQHFVKTYPLVTKAKVFVEQKPWKRVAIGGQAHDHGYALEGSEIRTTYVTADKAGKVEVTGGVKEMSVLKTTQSGYVGFLKDEYTMLPDSTDRILATTVTSTWKYSTLPPCFDAAFNAAKAGIVEKFYGPCKGGVYSPSVQYTLHQMGTGVLDKVPQIESIFFNCPNLHFLPCAPVTATFNNDVYVATSEPHGNIEAVVTRKGAVAHTSKL
eukprot:gene14548-20589_t